MTRAMTGWPSVGTLWLGEIENLISASAWYECLCTSIPERLLAWDPIQPSEQNIPRRNNSTLTMQVTLNPPSHTTSFNHKTQEKNQNNFYPRKLALLLFAHAKTKDGSAALTCQSHDIRLTIRARHLAHPTSKISSKTHGQHIRPTSRASQSGWSHRQDIWLITWARSLAHHMGPPRWPSG